MYKKSLELNDTTIRLSTSGHSLTEEDMRQFRVDHRSPVERMEDELKKSKAKEAKGKEAKKIKKKIVKEVSAKEPEPQKEEIDPFEDYDKENEVVNITLDPDKNVFKYYSLNKHERKALLKEDYEILKYKTMLSKKSEKYIVRPRFNESILHFFTIYDIQTFLESAGIKVQVFMTKKPDLVFYVNGKSYAIEVELGSVLKRSKQQVVEKHKVMKRDYDFGFIVVPIRRKIIEYRKIAPAVDMRYLKNKLEKILKKSRN
jgi:hypothetical protein